MRTVWVVLARWCDDAWPVAVFASEHRADKRVCALERLAAWAKSSGRSWSRMERGEWWDVQPVRFRDA